MSNPDVTLPVCYCTARDGPHVHLPPTVVPAPTRRPRCASHGAYTMSHNGICIECGREVGVPSTPNTED